MEVTNSKTETYSEQDLGMRVQQLFVERAAREHKDIVCHRNLADYTTLKKTGDLYDDPKAYHVLIDDNGNLLDMTPLIYAMLDTKEGLQYAKLKLL